MSFSGHKLLGLYSPSKSQYFEDACWKRHLQNIDSLWGNIGLRAYAQRNPINEFKKESFELFDSMIESFKDDSVKILFNIKIQKMSQAEFEARKNTT